MEVFIPETKNRYSINDAGIIFSNYRYNKNGKLIIRRIIVSKYDNCKNGYDNKKGRKYYNNSLCVSLWNGSRMKTYFVNTLMVELFKIKKPDKYHYYDIINVDNNRYNSSISNIGFKIRYEYDSNYEFYPQPFYNKKGKIIEKICGRCGNKKKINHFTLNINKITHNKTFRNICEQCRSIRHWNYIKSDDDRLKKFKEQHQKWELSEKGKLYRKEYQKKMRIFDHKNITPHYICTSLKLYSDRIAVTDLTPEFIKLAKKKIKLTRKLKSFKTTNNER